MQQTQLIEIRRAHDPDDAEALATLYQGYIDFLFERTPEARDAIAQKYPPHRVPEMVTDFFRIHARPLGEMLIAWKRDQPVGCAMMRQFEPGIVEIQRVFVSPEGRGQGLGRRLTRSLMDQARADGQKLARLDTGTHLTEAIALYESLGFRRIPAYHSATPQLDHLLIFFEADL